MISKKEFWIFIPARSGSKSIKNKNIKLIGKKPMFAHSIEIAKKIKIAKKIIFSSDSIKYYNIAKKYFNKNCEFHKRSKKISNDLTSDYEVFSSFLKQKLKKKKKIPEYLIHLRPTTPLRNILIVQKAIKKFLLNKNCSSLRSVSEMSNPSFKTFMIKNEKLYSFISKSFNIEKFNLPKENFPKTYIPNGYIDIVKSKNILKKTFHGNKVIPFIIDDNIFEIDNIKDLELLRKIV